MTDRVVRRVGRPAKEWVRTVLDDAIRSAGSLQQVYAIADDEHAWKRFTKTLIQGD